MAATEGLDQGILVWGGGELLCGSLVPEVLYQHILTAGQENHTSLSPCGEDQSYTLLSPLMSGGFKGPNPA